MACVGNYTDMRSICVGDDGAFADVDAGSLFVDHTTLSSKVSYELFAVAKQQHVSFVDAPVSRGGGGGRERTTVDHVQQGSGRLRAGRTRNG
ncbi:hypothetical protein TRM7615_04897 [Falsiruegeria mediterranea M17]|uniref:6-phosphogluconate dehydrogenase NADP-binding domain-containing protein n=1 Tax=Falsiruegeria mediterranea M17 TaxID=1200281 RepID=A0A2R8CFX9_9RHOB|nr:hypothetical protein TRM7615_04897 [Falsiruegeria mediterranea M17]